MTRGFQISSTYRDRYQFDSPEWRAVSGLIQLLTDEWIFAEAQQVEDDERRAEEHAKEVNQ